MTRHLCSIVFLLAVSIFVSSCDNKTERAGAGDSGKVVSDHPLFRISKDRKWGFIDESGKVVVEAQFNESSPFSEGLAAVCIGSCKYVNDDPNDKEVFSKNQTFQGQYGFIDSHGKMVINPRFSYVGDFRQGLAAAATGPSKWLKPNKIGYIDKAGNFVIPEQFQRAGEFDKGGLAVACVGWDADSKCGFIDKTGKYVINPQYYYAGDFENGIAPVLETTDSTTSYIDRTGKMIWKGELEKKQ